jgi:hypothetical protein
MWDRVRKHLIELLPLLEPSSIWKIANVLKCGLNGGNVSVEIEETSSFSEPWEVDNESELSVTDLLSLCSGAELFEEDCSRVCCVSVKRVQSI